MKTIFNITRQITAFTFLMALTSQAAWSANTMATAPNTKDVAIGLNEVYVPGGFDSHADAYVIANGLFPNGCYQWKGADVKHVDTFNHEIQSYATVNQGLCIMVLVPFSKEVRLGRLATGSHTLKFLNGDGTYLQKTMKIE